MFSCPIEEVSLPPSRALVSLALAVEKGQLATEAPYVLCESLHCPSSVWVAISQVETARAPPAYSGHLQCSAYCCVAISHCLCPQSLVSQRYIVSMQLPFRLCWDGHIWIWGSLSHALMLVPQLLRALCVLHAASFSSLLHRQICRPSVSHLYLIFCQGLTLKMWLMPLSCLNKPLVAHVSVSLANRLPSHDSSEVITVRNRRNLHQVSPKTRGISKKLYQIDQWALVKDRLVLKQNLPCWLH